MGIGIMGWAVPGQWGMAGLRHCRTLKILESVQGRLIKETTKLVSL